MAPAVAGGGPQLPEWLGRLWNNCAFKLEGAREQRVDSRRVNRHGARDHYSLCFVHDQERQLRQGDRVLVIAPGQACLLPPGMAYTEQVLPLGRDSAGYFMEFFCLLTSRHGDPLAHLPMPLLVDLADPAAYLARFRALCACCTPWRPQGAEGYLAARPLVDQLLADTVLAFFAADAGQAARVGAAVPRWLWTLRDHLRASCQQADLRLADCARLTGYSASQISHAFRQHFGVAPMAFVQGERLALARRFLEERREADIAVIGRRCGFASASAFSRAFRAAFAMSPTQWRRQRVAEG